MTRMGLEWKAFGSRMQYDGPPVVEHRAKLGEDAEGRTWWVRTEPVMEEGIYRVAFDYEDEEDTLFLKDRVVNANLYWKARREVYHERNARYEDIGTHIRTFIREHGLNTKDVCGHYVKDN